MPQNSDLVEDCQALLACACADVDEALLRNRQAIRRTPLVRDVLAPAVERLERVKSDLTRARWELRRVWNETNGRGNG